MRADIVPGAVFPDYDLSDHHGKHRTLSELQGGDPLVLVLARGGFCPKDRRQHEGLVQLHREMQVGYCRLVTISTDNLLETNEFRAGVGAHWTFLSDAGRTLQKDLDIAEYTDPDHNPMIPHTVVLEPGLRIHKIYNGYWFFGRPTVEEDRKSTRLNSSHRCISYAVFCLNLLPPRPCPLFPYTTLFRSVGAHWTFLSDAGRTLQKDLDIAEYTDPDHNPMIPHTVVLEPGLRIHKIYNGYWFFGRPTVE